MFDFIGNYFCKNNNNYDRITYIAKKHYNIEITKYTADDIYDHYLYYLRTSDNDPEHPDHILHDIFLDRKGARSLLEPISRIELLHKLDTD